MAKAEEKYLQATYMDMLIDKYSWIRDQKEHTSRFPSAQIYNEKGLAIQDASDFAMFKLTYFEDSQSYQWAWSSWMSKTSWKQTDECTHFFKKMKVSL